MSRKITLGNVDNLIAQHLTGKSVKCLAAELGVSRPTLLRHFAEAGFRQRTRSEAMFTRMAHTTPSERKHLAEAANRASRGQKRSLEERLKRARAWEHTVSKAGFGEAELVAWLTERGHECFWQKAVHVYNIDIAIPPVAVELSFGTSHPMRRTGAFDRRKIEYLTDHEWFVIYILLSDRSLFCEAIADYLHTTIELVKRQPSMLGQYWVIRGSGKEHFSLRRDRN